MSDAEQLLNEIVTHPERREHIERQLAYYGLRHVLLSCEKERENAEARIQQLEEDNLKLEKALKFQKDQNKMLMEGRRGL